MTAEEIIQIIAENSLTVRCLPLEVKEAYSFKQEEFDKGGYELKIWCPDLEYFENSQFLGNAKSRYEAFYKRFPKGRKFMVRTRYPEKGGWWYVKEKPDTSSTVCFNRKHDKFFAPSLEEAVQLYLNSKK